MAPFPVVPMFAWLLLAVGDCGGAAKSFFCEAFDLQVAEDCPRCDDIFSMLETTPSGERVQTIRMEERGNVR